jgi:hypothetical protein
VDAGRGLSGTTPALPAGEPSSIDHCPYGIPVKLLDKEGNSAIGIRSEYAPHFYNESRSAGLGFTPTAWEIL